MPASSARAAALVVLHVGASALACGGVVSEPMPSSVGAAGAGPTGSSRGGTAGENAQAGMGGTGPTLTAEGFAAVLAETICARAGPCCALAGVSPPSPTCFADVMKELEASTYLRPTPERPSFFPIYAARCIEAHRAALANCGYEPGAYPSAEQTCNNVFRGDVPLGGTCAREADCAPNDDAFDVACVGNATCVARMAVNEGDVCNSDIDFGGSSLTAWGGGPILVCRAVDGLDCQRDASADDGTKRCVALAKLGQRCLPSGCLEGHCDHDVCAAVGTGTACTGFYCSDDQRWMCDSTSCVPSPRPGDSCWPECGPGSTCDRKGAGTCALQLPSIAVTRRICAGE